MVNNVDQDARAAALNQALLVYDERYDIMKSHFVENVGLAPDWTELDLDGWTASIRVYAD